jgi:hypothetical protein
MTEPPVLTFWEELHLIGHAYVPIEHLYNRVQELPEFLG